ncbi:hypothetical protein ARMGADRAFT_1007503 [Armillaria gallica]|uniref:Uncharacterized protein n=1 Tax=Armillaria gallica TaxID=47427 RepID=A0A2H3E250_ARMGA|nr:hypothetical protein ARMGADRAFT_1007503 [Armillaria gallica]
MMRDTFADFSTTSAYEAVDSMSELYSQVLSHAAKARARKDLLAIHALDTRLVRVGGSMVQMDEDVMLEFAVHVDSQSNMSYPTVVAEEELQSEDDDESVQVFSPIHYGSSDSE